MITTQNVRFSQANAKIERLSQVDNLQPYLDGDKSIYSFDLISGYSCPFANECLSKAVKNDNGKRTIRDGKNTKTRCFSASQEVQYTNVYNLRLGNFEALKGLETADEIADVIESQLPDDAGIVRIHVAGDFFNQRYLKAWLIVAKRNTRKLFYAYTKSLPYWINLLDEINQLENLVLTASKGGKFDRLIDEFNLRQAVIVFSELEAKTLGLEIDHDDSHAADPSKRNQSFSLLIHGTQPKGSDAAAALTALKGLGSYSRKKA
jgi:hypothetical protein